MTDDGTMLYNATPRAYEDGPSLKRYVKSQLGLNYVTGTMHEQLAHINQLTTGTDVEVEMGAATAAIAQIGKNEIAVKLGASADGAATNAIVYTLVYFDSAMVSHTAVATGTATLDTTQVAFTPAIADFYAAYSFTASAGAAGINVYVETSGSTAVWATITAAATAATEAQLLGVGAIYGRGSADHADADNKLLYLCYENPAGIIKYGHCTLTATSTDEIRFFEATDDGDGTTTATTTTVKDFYRVRWFRSSAAATANAYFIITDADCGNIDGSSGDVYAAILAGNDAWATSRFHVRVGYTAWLIDLRAFIVQSAAGDGVNLILNYTPKGHAATSKKIIIQGSIQYSDPIALEEDTDFYVETSDIANAVTLCLDLAFIEVQDA